MTITETFRVSSHLKDIIGRDLVTNEFIAIFELVKNSFDAGAKSVDIEFDPDERTITIVDDGHGMSAKDIREKWLFVAYSEKALPSETYRDRIRPSGQFAGSKGIGRFACDTLGSHLDLYSVTNEETQIQKLEVDWTQFEKSSSDEFQGIGVTLRPVDSFPEILNARTPVAHGTVLVIRDTRQIWDNQAIGKLRRDLAKLIDPFGTTTHVTVSTWLLDGGETIVDGVDGPIGNDIAQLLLEKTSRIEVSISHNSIETQLFDRGRKIYQIREPSPYEELEGASIKGSIYFLNRSAKHTFTSRMGVRPIEFGSVFLFLNRFRIFPIGEEFDDTLGLNRRKQQGQSRYLGTRDLLGRVDVTAPPRMFREVSSRDAGLIDDARSRVLFEAVRKHMIFRLERYVVGVNWKDAQDQDRDTAEGLETQDARARLLTVVGGLARSKDVEVIYYDQELVRIPDDPDQVTESALKAMADLAEKQGDDKLVTYIDDTRRRIQELRESQLAAEASAKRALEERALADARIERLEQQAAFLGSSQDVDVERAQLLVHQAIIHLGHVRSGIINAAHDIRDLLENAEPSQATTGGDEIEDLLATIRQKARRTSASIAAANLSSERLGAVLSFSQNIRVDLDTDRVRGDMLQFFSEYIQYRIAGVPDLPTVTFEANDLTLSIDFSPVDIAVLIDNLVDNARKASATKVTFTATKSPNDTVMIRIVDDGIGIDERKIDPAKIFERGYTGSRSGTGLGLYSSKQIIEKIGGSIDLADQSGRADFEITFRKNKGE